MLVLDQNIVFLFQTIMGEQDMLDYCPSHVPVQTHFLRSFYNILLNQAQTHLDHLKVLDKLSNLTTGKEFTHRPPL